MVGDELEALDPARLPGEIPGRLTQNVAFLFQELTDSPTQLRVLILDRAGHLTGGRPRPGRSRAGTPALIIGPDPATQRLAVDAQVVSDQRDRRTRPRPVQRDRIGLELRPTNPRRRVLPSSPP